MLERLHARRVKRVAWRSHELKIAIFQHSRDAAVDLALLGEVGSGYSGCAPSSVDDVPVIFGSKNFESTRELIGGIGHIFYERIKSGWCATGDVSNICSPVNHNVIFCEGIGYVNGTGSCGDCTVGSGDTLPSHEVNNHGLHSHLV